MQKDDQINFRVDNRLCNCATNIQTNLFPGLRFRYVLIILLKLSFEWNLGNLLEFRVMVLRYKNVCTSETNLKYTEWLRPSQKWHFASSAILGRYSRKYRSRNHGSICRVVLQCKSVIGCQWLLLFRVLNKLKCRICIKLVHYIEDLWEGESYANKHDRIHILCGCVLIYPFYVGCSFSFLIQREW